MLTQEDLKQIPLRYRLFVKILLKLPIPSLPFFVLKHAPELEGFLYFLFLPMVLAVYYWFGMWLIAFLSLTFGFPLNIILWLLIPGLIFVFSLRLQLERTILWWKAISQQPRDWHISEKVEELIELLDRQRKGKKKS